MTGDTTRNRRLAAACAGLALGVAAVAAVGVFGRGEAATQTIVTVRGERVELVTDGIYAYNAERLVAEGVAWDLFTLFGAVPGLLIAAVGLHRGSLRARLIALGLLAYFFYQYFMYATAWAFGPLFVPFVAVYAASLAIGVWVGSTIRATEVAARCTDRFPLRGMAFFSFIVATVLVSMWTARIVAALRGDLEAGMLLGQTTMVVQALDLGLIVPLALFTGVLALKRRPLGYVLAAVLAVKGAALAAAISLMVIRAGLVQGSLEWGGLTIFGTATAVCVWLGSRMWRSCDG